MLTTEKGGDCGKGGDYSTENLPSGESGATQLGALVVAAAADAKDNDRKISAAALNEREGEI